MKPTLTPVTIPAEILGLKNAKLPEKLLLSMCVADSKATRVRRAMSMTRAGLRKLEQRLIEKELLTVEGDRYTVHVPGLVYIGHEADGHSVSSSHAMRNKKKVARQVSKTARTDIAPLLVPAELLHFKYLTAAEKMLLAFLAANPSVKNKCVLTTLGLSSSGLKKLKNCLLSKRVLISSGAGFTIRLPGHVLVQDSTGGHFIPESIASKTGNKVATPSPRLTPPRDILKPWSKRVKNKRHVPGPELGDFQSYTARMIQRIESESPDGPEREAALKLMREYDNYYFALQFVYDNIPRKHEAHYKQLIYQATPEQLAAFRLRVEGMTLAGIPEAKQLGMVTEVIAQMVQH